MKFYTTSRGKRVHFVNDGQSQTICGLPIGSSQAQGARPDGKKKDCGTCKVLVARTEGVGATSHANSTTAPHVESAAA